LPKPFDFVFDFSFLSKMILYKCRFTHDEMLTDAFKPRPVVDDEGNVVEGLIEIDSQKVNKVRVIVVLHHINMCFSKDIFCVQNDL
jgi:Translationally controlled tumour protein